jgi:hypothetical protein
MLDNLAKAVAHATEHKIKSNAQILHELKSASSSNKGLNTALSSLSRHIYEYYKPVIDKDIKHIQEHGILHLKEYSFKTPLEYLKHIRNKPANSFMQHHMDKHIEQHQQPQKQLQMELHHGPHL